jgi:hypothetical protein
MAGGAEIPPFARESEQVLVPTGVAADPGKALGKVGAAEERHHDPADDRAIEAVLLLVPLCVARLELGEVGLHALVEG